MSFLIYYDICLQLRVYVTDTQHRLSISLNLFHRPPTQHIKYKCQSTICFRLVSSTLTLLIAQASSERVLILSVPFG